MYMYMKIWRAEQTRQLHVFWAGWPSSEPCTCIHVHVCLAGLDLHVHIRTCIPQARCQNTGFHLGGGGQMGGIWILPPGYIIYKSEPPPVCSQLRNLFPIPLFWMKLIDPPQTTQAKHHLTVR